MAVILTALLDSLEANLPGTIRDIDTEFLHDLRVAVRWTRSALKLCGEALPDGLAARYAPEFRWLGDLTTPTRDLDVFLLGYPAMAAGLVGAEIGELIPFRDHLTRSRAVAYRQLRTGLRSARFARLLAGWRTALVAGRPARRPTVAQLADAKIAAAHRKALRVGGQITPSSPPQSLHDLRKRCKELRYLVEMFGSLHDPAERWHAVRELKSLQDCLGEFQDAEVQRAEVRAFAAQMMADRSAPAETLLAMGEIAASLAVRQARARAQFDGRFTSFAGPASRRRIAGLAQTGIKTTKAPAGAVVT
jgi:CHAD domain-containing protein